MRLTTITNWAYGITVALTLVSGVTMLAASDAQERERDAINERHRLGQATGELGDELYALTEHARQYLNVGDPTYLTVYRSELERLAPLEERLQEAMETGLTAEELNILNEAMRLADALQAEQDAALTAYAAGEEATARQILFGAEYQRELDKVEASMARFRDRLDARIDTEVAAAVRVAKDWRLASEVMIAGTGLLFLCVLFFIFRQRVLRPVVKLSDVVMRLAAQDYDAQPPELHQIDEIGDMAQALRVFRENGLERQRLEAERDADLAVRDLLWRMTERMQGCDTPDDLMEVVQRFVPEIAPGRAGRLYVLDKERNAVVEACNWSDPRYSEKEFPPVACWAMRRGQPHRPAGKSVDVPCNHLGLTSGPVPDTLCLPLIAQRETLGLLYLEPRLSGEATGACDVSDVYLGVLTENISLALSNLRLREALREMAMVDPMTGLSNRRRLDTVQSVLLTNARKLGQPIGCLMMDVDHFKRFNDDYGHEAGDIVLKEIAAVLQDSTREAEFVFRYGGEEFMMLIPNLRIEQLKQRAEEIRKRIAALHLVHDGRDLGAITVSIGVACAPDNAYDDLTHAADSALLHAKAQGRNRVEPALPQAARLAIGE